MVPRTLAVTLAVTLPLLAHAAPPDDDDDVHTYEFAADMLAGEMSATPGGAQDIRHFRDRVEAGEIPHPNVFTPEGLFSEHDLPLATGSKCRKLLCPIGEATEARLLAQPEVRYLGQLGFSTNIDAKKFHRAPLNLVAVVDKSGSMMDVLPLVRRSLRQLVGQLGRHDQISIVQYGDVAETLLPPTAATRAGKAQIRRAIARLETGGSTAMEDGLQRGFAVARASQARFAGTSRVMLFTDERPNVGATDAGSFMQLAEDGSRDGIGLTTIGVGLQFGAELATKISSVRGGNLFFFPDAPTMVETFEDELDTMVTELAHDLRLTIHPARGTKLAGIYGIPGEALHWTRDGGIELEVATLFVSRKAGAIYVAVAPDGNDALPSARLQVGDTIASVAMSFTPLGGKRTKTAVDLTMVESAGASTGLTRGALLVDEITALKEATRRHHESNDQEGAYRLVHALAGRFRGNTDPGLGNERELVLQLERTLAKRSGHAGEPAPTGTDPVTGLPGRLPVESPEE